MQILIIYDSETLRSCRFQHSPICQATQYFLRYFTPRKEIYKHIKHPKQNVRQENSVNISTHTHILSLEISQVKWATHKIQYLPFSAVG